MRNRLVISVVDFDSLQYANIPYEISEAISRAKAGINRSGAVEPMGIIFENSVIVDLLARNIERDLIENPEEDPVDMRKCLDELNSYNKEVHFFFRT